jgi:Holliday junction resolvase-like predicted endonuclease
MTMQKQAFGQWGEETAAAYLEANGYILLERNFHTAHSEIDIVASKAACSFLWR